MEPFEKKITMKYTYPDNEKMQMGERIAKLEMEAKQKRLELEELKSQQKTEREEIEVVIEGKKATISELCEKLFNGCEERATKCMVRLNYPIDGKKTIYNLETAKNTEGKISDLEDCDSWIEDMTDADYHLFPNENEIPDPHQEGWYLENYGFDPNGIDPKIEEFYLVDSPMVLKDHGFNKKLFKDYRDCLMFKGTGAQYSNALDNAPEEIDFRCSLDIEDSDEKWFVFGPLNMKKDDEEAE